MYYWWAVLGVGILVALGAYALALRIRLMAVVDLIWTTGVGLAALAYCFVADVSGTRAWLVLATIGVWSGRLTLYLLRDRVLAGKEDRRYAALAEHWGAQARRNFAGVFLIQVPFVMLFTLPVTVALRHGGPLGWPDLPAVLIAAVALGGEALADRQLARFRSDPENKGGVCQEGLWRYSRHPNYFFEWLHWWAYPLFAFGGPQWWLALTGPVSMYLFLRFITGVPHAERSSLGSRGDAYRKYQATTNAFFPWKPHAPRS